MQNQQKSLSKLIQLKQNKSLDYNLSKVNLDKNCKSNASLISNRFPKYWTKNESKPLIASSEKRDDDSITRKIQTKLLSGLKDNQQENYFRQKPDKKQKSMIVMNIETQCSSNTAHKGIRSMSFLTYNNKSQTKTMKDLSKKKFAGTSNVFDSIQYSQRKTPNFYDRPMFSNLSRNTPIDKYKNKEGIKGRLMRGQYSSSHLQNNSVCSGFDLLKDIKQNLKDDKFKNNSVLKPHDSTLVKEYWNEYYNLGSTQESLKDINSIENFSEDNGNISKEKSIISGK